MAVLILDLLKHSGPTPEDDMAPQIITDWKLHTGLQATSFLCLSILPPDSGTLISKLNEQKTTERQNSYRSQENWSEMYR